MAKVTCEHLIPYNWFCRLWLKERLVRQCRGFIACEDYEPKKGEPMPREHQEDLVTSLTKPESEVEDNVERGLYAVAASIEKLARTLDVNLSDLTEELAKRRRFVEGAVK